VKRQGKGEPHGGNRSAGIRAVGAGIRRGRRVGSRSAGKRGGVRTAKIIRADCGAAPRLSRRSVGLAWDVGTAPATMTINGRDEQAPGRGASGRAVGTAVDRPERHTPAVDLERVTRWGGESPAGGRLGYRDARARTLAGQLRPIRARRATTAWSPAGRTSRTFAAESTVLRGLAAPPDHAARGLREGQPKSTPDPQRR